MEFPPKSFVVDELRSNPVNPVRLKIIATYVIGSFAKGMQSSKSDIDIAVVIPKLRTTTSLQFTENFHFRFTHQKQKPKWNGRIIDIQFYFEDDDELDLIPKIELD